MIEFSMDKFDPRKDVEKIVNDDLRARATKAQRALDAVHRSHKADPAAAVRPQVEAAWSRAFGESPEEDELSAMTATIEGGGRVTFGAEPFRLSSR